MKKAKILEISFPIVGNKTLPAMLGHFSIGFMLDAFAHVTETMKRNTADKISGVLKGGRCEGEPGKGSLLIVCTETDDYPHEDGCRGGHCFNLCIDPRKLLNSIE